MNSKEIYELYQHLPLGLRKKALYIGCEMALEVWETHAKDRTLEYIDGVVGMHHVVDKTLPKRVMDAIRLKLASNQGDGKALEQEYMEPIVAMQDEDLEFPENIEYAYYAIYNLFRLVFGLLGAPEENIILNQFLTAQTIHNTQPPPAGMTVNDEVQAAFQKWYKKAHSFRFIDKNG